MSNLKNDIDQYLIDDSDMIPTTEQVQIAMDNRRKSLLREFDFLNPSMSLEDMLKLVDKYYEEHPELLNKKKTPEERVQEMRNVFGDLLDDDFYELFREEEPLE